MSRKSRNLLNAETALIRKFMEQNLELGKSHEDIIQQLNISRATYYRHVKRIMDEDAKIWDKVHMDSAKYRAQRLVESLLNCVNVCKQIMNDPKTKPDDRIEAYKTAAEASANIYKLVAEGPTFKVTVSQSKLPFDNQELTNNDTKQLPN